ncbi:unnamed protein product [Pleuronectes platessa]|uniref:Uncharacterized protein n=1 Tax=Pleuronectes platessa TaxID=8262 RepID=A0A9N7VXP9_PLEPL|nr:unnamed protein product [Pleuronectes platessa]
MHQPLPAPAHGLSPAPPGSREDSPFTLCFTLVTFISDELLVVFQPTPLNPLAPPRQVHGLHPACLIWLVWEYETRAVTRGEDVVFRWPRLVNQRSDVSHSAPVAAGHLVWFRNFKAARVPTRNLCVAARVHTDALKSQDRWEHCCPLRIRDTTS